MTDRTAAEAWVGRYRRAWETNDTDEIRDLFAPDADYYTAGMMREPWRGRAEIVAGWLDRKDQPGTTEFDWQVIAVDGDLAVVRGVTRYLRPEQATYENVWLLRLGDDGRATEFVEYWMEHP